MAGTSKPYAVVSCHVERILDDRVWEAYRAFIRSRPGRFPVASLVRPPDETHGEAADTWLERARELATAGPIGHHTHWTAPDHARPSAGAETARRVLDEAAWLRAREVHATCFCGGGWYTDATVIAACATLGYVDCTPRPARPAHLGSDDAWAQLDEPALVETPTGEALVIPTTHSLGETVRLALSPKGLPGSVVHSYFHDTDLLDARRRRSLRIALAVLGRRRTPCDLDTLAGRVRPGARVVPVESVARGRRARPPQ